MTSTYILDGKEGGISPLGRTPEMVGHENYALGVMTLSATQRIRDGIPLPAGTRVRPAPTAVGR